MNNNKVIPSVPETYSGDAGNIDHPVRTVFGKIFGAYQRPSTAVAEIASSAPPVITVDRPNPAARTFFLKINEATTKPLTGNAIQGKIGKYPVTRNPRITSDSV